MLKATPNHRLNNRATFNLCSIICKNIVLACLMYLQTFPPPQLLQASGRCLCLETRLLLYFRWLTGSRRKSATIPAAGYLSPEPEGYPQTSHPVPTRESAPPCYIVTWSCPVALVSHQRTDTSLEGWSPLDVRGLRGRGGKLLCKPANGRCDWQPFSSCRSSSGESRHTMQDERHRQTRRQINRWRSSVGG